jgi:hypothetical protein
MAPKHVLVLHRAHTFIANVEPSFPITALAVWVVHVDRKVTAACGLTVVVKNSIELVVRRLRRFSGNGCHMFWTDRATRDS